MAQSLDLFGTRKHKARISELQQQIEELRAENRKLETQLDKRSKKTKTATARKQEVEEILNQAQQRITTLENELATIASEMSGDLSFSGTHLLNKKNFEDVVFKLGSVRSESKTLHSVYLTGTASVSDFEFGDFIDESCIYLFDQIKSHNGKVLFYDEDHCITLAIVPPFAIVGSEWVTDDTLDLNPLKTMLEREGAICGVYAHAGRTVVGIIRGRGGHDVSAEIVRTGVQAKHTKGGWSQRRFERGRDEAIEHHVGKVREHLRSMWGAGGDQDDRTDQTTGIDRIGQIDLIVAGGDLRLARKMLEGTKIPVIEKRVDAEGAPEDVVARVVWAGRLYRL